MKIYNIIHVRFVGTIPSFMKLIRIICIVFPLIAGINSNVINNLSEFYVMSIATLTVSFSWYCYSTRWERRRKKYWHIISKHDFLTWQLAILKNIYSDLEFVKLWGKEYPVTCMPANQYIRYPFSSLCTLISDKLHETTPDKEQKRYIKLLGNTVKWPNMKGFALDRIYLNEKQEVKSISAITSNYYQNLITAHILEWELYKCYLSRDIPFPYDTDSSTILKNLPYRDNYHGNRISKDVICSPSRAFPLLSVQALVVFRSAWPDGKYPWRVVTSCRSMDVAIKPGQIQFFPAGGFEIYGTESEINIYHTHDSFDPKLALFREYAEELFNAEHLQINRMGIDPAMAIYTHPSISFLIRAINNKKAWMHFLGIVVDLTVMRHELSFLIIIDDEDFCFEGLKGCNESTRILAVPLDELENYISKEILHVGSAGLFHMAKHSGYLKDLHNNH